MALIDGLVLYVKGDETAGSYNGTAGEVIDSSNEGNNGYAVGGANTVTGGLFNNEITFDGTDDLVLVPANTSLELTNCFTFQTWFTLNAYVSERYIATQAYDNNNRFLFKLRDYKYQIAVYTEDGYAALISNEYGHNKVGTRVHLVITYDGSTVTFYFNGAVDKTAALTGSIVTTGTSEFSIGARNTGANPTNANQDEIALWNTCKSASEVTELYNSGAGVEMELDTTAPTVATPIALNVASEYWGLFQITAPTDPDFDYMECKTVVNGGDTYYYTDVSGTATWATSGTNIKFGDSYCINYDIIRQGLSEDDEVVFSVRAVDTNGNWSSWVSSDTLTIVNTIITQRYYSVEEMNWDVDEDTVTWEVTE